MSEARSAIFSAIREALGRGPIAAPAPRPAHTRPAFDGDLVARLCTKLEGRAATTERLAAIEHVPQAVARYLQRQRLPPPIDVAPALAGLAWPAELTRRVGRADIDSTVSVTPCLAAIAEAGSLMLLSGASTPTTLNFVPEHHLVVVHAAQVVKHVEDAWVRLRGYVADTGGIPRTINMISGPSRTADIEQTIQLGAHGPRRLHVMVVED